MRHENLVVFDVETVTDAGDHEGTGSPKPPHHVPVGIAHLRSGTKVSDAGTTWMVAHFGFQRPTSAKAGNRGVLRRLWGFDWGGDVDAVAENVLAFDDDVAEIVPHPVLKAHRRAFSARGGHTPKISSPNAHRMPVSLSKPYRWLHPQQLSTNHQRWATVPTGLSSC